MGGYYLAVDIGASSGRHILGHLEGDKLVLEEIHRFPNGMQEINGEKCWDYRALFQEILMGMKKCGELGKIPDSVSVDTWGVDFVLLDERDQILGNTVGYRDNRTLGMEEKVYERIPEDALYARTGIQKAIFNTIYQLMAVKEKHPDYLVRAKSFLMVPDYFHYLLCGVKANEYTEASTSQLLNPMTKDWDWELMDLLGFPREIFRQVQVPGTVLGVLTEAIRQEVGYTCQVVLPASHDTGSAVLAVPSNEPDTVYISSGTWSLMGVEREAADCSMESRAHNFTNEGGYQYRFRYLKNIMGLWMIQSVKAEMEKEQGISYTYEALCREAALQKIASLVDCNDGRFLAPKNMTQEICQACLESGQQVPVTNPETAAVVYNSLAKCYQDTIQEIETLTGRTYQSIHIVGGGSNASYLNQLTAAQTGRTVYAGPTEATAIGNLMVQMLTAGEWKDLDEARKCVFHSFGVVTVKSIESLKKRRIRMSTQSRYEEAKAKYRAAGVDTDKALEQLKQIPIAMHCWQGDDVEGFEGAGALTGGIQTTGNYPGKASTPEELMADMDKALALIPGKHKINLHASYGIFEDGKVADRDQLEPKHFAKWVEYAKARGLGIDFNPTCFSHPLAADGTLSSENEEIRSFWIRHCQACIRISEYFATELGIPCVMNIWVPDGYKDIPADRTAPRARLKDSLDQIIAVPYDKSKVYLAVESKVFGIGLESYTVGSHEFYMNYAAKNNLLCLLDNGHYHPTEVVSDKISSMLLFYDKLALHVTRSVRWDSDHVVRYDDETKEIAKEIIMGGAERIFIALDFFDASINRVAAWIIGMRNMQKALLSALLTPNAKLTELQQERKLTQVFALQEEYKLYPIGDVWDYYCEQNGVPVGEAWLEEVEKYEEEVLLKR